MFAKSEIAVEIPLKTWQDPQGNVVLRYSREECLIYFGCWDEAGEPANYLCQLTFHDAWAIRGLCFEWHSYKTKELKAHSRILVIENSRWLRRVTRQRLKNYPRWKTWETRRYLHYLVTGHDNFYEIIATSFAEEIIPKAMLAKLATLIRDA